jgi:hypothetical protein
VLENVVVNRAKRLRFGLNIRKCKPSASCGMIHSCPLEKSPLKKRVTKVVIGRERFAKISAVEGIQPSAAMRKRVAQFDRQGLSAAERRREIIKAHKKG